MLCWGCPYTPSSWRLRSQKQLRPSHCHQQVGDGRRWGGSSLEALMHWSGITPVLIGQPQEKARVHFPAP